MKKKPKTKVVYKDDGETIYSMVALDGITPEEAEQRAEERKKRVKLTRKEKRAMISAGYRVYGPILLIFVVAFAFVALVLYLIMK